MGAMKIIRILVLVWVSKGFFTIDSMVSFINTLPLERAVESKIVACNSNRMFVSPYVLIYRIEKN